MSTKPDILHDMEGCFLNDEPEGWRRIAWSGVSFCVPSRWEIAVYKSPRRGVTRIELDDVYSLRLEAEWIQGGKNLSLDRIMSRYDKASKPLTLKAEERHNIEGLPQGWRATRFEFRETAPEKGGAGLRVVKHALVTAFYLCPGSSAFCFFILHFMPGDEEDSAATVRRLAFSFQDHRDDAFTPWRLFDIAFKVPREFVLEETRFDIGAKLMIFGWKRRRFFLWHFSCAGMFLKNGVVPEEWAAGYLNGFSGIKGPVFLPDGEGELTWKRRRPHFLGHWNEIARLCRRYRCGCRRLDDRDQLVVWVFHYRSEEDLATMRAVI